ncbi:MAG: hypothetical protein ACI86M_000658 [Saprospiraceae bacterium]|jgi:hypothetical protein
MIGNNNIVIGFLIIGSFMAYDFLLIYLRNISSGKEEWDNSYSIGKHFETRLAHVHGNLFAFLNILIGYLILMFSKDFGNDKGISWLALIGLFISLVILTEVYCGVSLVLALIGAIAMAISVLWLAISFWKMKEIAADRSGSVKHIRWSP